MGRVVTTKPKPIFQRAHELAKAVKSLKKISAKALEVLEKGMDSKDEKTRMLAAEKVLAFYERMSKEVNQDQMNRLLLEIKASGLIGQGSTTDDDDTPVLNFDEIHPSFRDVVDAENVVDLSDVNKLG